MNQFQEMLREAFTGAEPFAATPTDRAAVEAAIERIAQRDRMMRTVVWSSVTFMTAVAAWAAATFFTLTEPTPRELILRATLFLFAIITVGQLKGILFLSQRDLAIQRELKRLQIQLLEGPAAHDGRGP